MNATVFCNKCGTGNAAASQFCSHCGTPMGAPISAVPAASSGAPLTAPLPAYPQPAYPVVQAGVGYGGFWIRVVAAIIDAIVVRVLVFPFAALLGVGGLAMGGLGAGLGAGLGHGAALPFVFFGGGVMILLTLGAGWLYEALMESSSYQATLGKMIFGMKVTDLNGNRISFGRATGRHFAKILSGMILCIGFIMAGVTERKQGLHDMLAGTLVRRP